MALTLGLSLVAVGLSVAAQPTTPAPRTAELANRYWQLRVTVTEGQVRVRFQDKLQHLCLAEGPYLYRAERGNGQAVETFRGLQGAQVTATANKLVIRGQLAGLELEHCFELLRNRPVLEERVVLRNRTDRLISAGRF